MFVGVNALATIYYIFVGYNVYDSPKELLMREASNLASEHFGATEPAEHIVEIPKSKA